MPNFKKNRVNPYLFILLKRMMEYEVCESMERPSKKRIADYIDARGKRRNPSSKPIGETLRTNIFTPLDFDFSNDKLDELVTEVAKIDRFDSWTDYVSKYKGDIGAIIAERDYMACSFSELSNSDQEKIFTWVEKKILQLHLKAIRNDKNNEHNIIVDANEHVIRTINSEEVYDMLLLSQDHYPGDIERAKKILQKNPNVYYIYKDDYDTWGYISIFPIKEASLYRLQNEIHPITLDDIYTKEEKNEVKSVYIEKYFSKHPAILQFLENNYYCPTKH